jgi:hypothetical protein
MGERAASSSQILKEKTMRLKRELVAERESFLKELFKNEPKTSAKDANEALKTKYGKYMRLQRVYDIKKEAVVPAPVA